MKKAGNSMNDLPSDRTPPVIAAEINAIKHQTGKIILAGAIEIGRRLKEVKELLPYGEWGKWLEDSISYSQKTAERLMKIFEAYGAKADASLDVGTQEQGQTLTNLNYSQALILLGVPEKERVQLIAELDVESMSARELTKAVNERSQALKERDRALQEKADLRKDLEEQAGQITQLSTERDNLKTNAEELRNSKAEVEARALALERELLSVEKSLESESVKQLKKDLNAANLRARVNKITLLYESLDRAFKDLTWEIKNLAADDPEAYKVYRKRVKDFLSRCSNQTI
ncbi:DUF3102 domain-containing protein [Desulfosporosinus sp. PR]|uniref:DUF3102 domain-containing protein n=1 Tax=Candidatus Desulfosporosinus nitrosoreducens TaxID=3401928 RepID=UPI0027EDC5E8|nr:DUF3102 domain-containing protein [Desulfosporosinus sp. PR]MDQ7093614.1 DUF3102 domain-containing protein [Desulfosporosinus sp. PR]